MGSATVAVRGATIPLWGSATKERRGKERYRGCEALPSIYGEHYRGCEGHYRPYMGSATVAVRGATIPLWGSATKERRGKERYRGCEALPSIYGEHYRGCEGHYHPSMGERYQRAPWERALPFAPDLLGHGGDY
ncbi:hypothetical protein EDD15DRAFT_2199280 [Pisolithus albus]|nr:hypothetical protein EDD15DRAFT_2199280 [Pisolithus albus]